MGRSAFHQCGGEAMPPEIAAALIFASSALCCAVAAYIAISGSNPPDPSVHWPGHSWIHFMKRLHVIMSIGCFLIELCALFFSIFALHRVLAGGFDAQHASSTIVLLTTGLEFEFVAVSSYFFAGTMLLLGPVAIRCFRMVQQGLRSDSLAASVMCLIVGVVLLILSFFNAHLASFPYASFEQLLFRFITLSYQRCLSGGRPAAIMVLAWTLQLVSLILAICSLSETLPWVYYRDERMAEVYREQRIMGMAASGGRDPAPLETITEPGQVLPNRSRPGSPPAQIAGTVSDGVGGARVTGQARHRRVASGGAPNPAELWQEVFKDPRLAMSTNSFNIFRTNHQAKFARGASVASSMNSLDSLVVD